MERQYSRRWRGSYRRRRKKSWSERLADWTRNFIAFLFSNVGIIGLVVGYTIAGAFIFQTIEGNHLPTGSEVVGDFRNETARNLWNLTSKCHLYKEFWNRSVLEELQKYQNKMVDAVKDGYEGMNTRDEWSFTGSFLYSLTVITTIGYGNIFPRTVLGKIVTVIYAIAGMPLFLLYLSNIGDILARSFKWTYARCCLCRCRRRPRELEPPPPRDIVGRDQWQMVRMHGDQLDTSSIEQESSEEEEDDNEDSEGSYDPQNVTVPLTLCLAIMVGYICGGASLFYAWEGWEFLEGSYFCFISLSTIGFGDIVPGEKTYSDEGFDLSFVFCSMYLMLGMALIAMCFNLMQEEVMSKIRALARTTRYIFRCDR